MYSQPDARVAEGTATTADAIELTVESDYYYEYNGDMVYEDLTWYDYYAVRGYAVVESAGIGTYGSEGFETCGSDLEIDAFACVIEWLTGDRVAYTDLTSNVQISAEDWCSGKVGMTGRSYAGTTQFALANSNIKGLETVVPVAGIASWYEYTNGQGVYLRTTADYTQGLGWYCNSRFEHESWDSISYSYGSYMNAALELQTEANGDYNIHWAIRDYTLNAEERAELVEMGILTERYDIGTDNLSCPALIVHGLNDFNVRTKQSDLMFDAFKEAGQNVKILFHQGQHLTPTYPAGGFEMYVGLDGELITYDELLNLWFSHYLFGIDNNIENMPEVTAQSNMDVNTWNTYDSWDTDLSVELPLSLATDDATTDFGYSTTATYSFTVPEDYNVYGTMELKLTGSFDITNESVTDALRINATVYEADEDPFVTYVGSTYSSSLTVLEENGAWMGGGVENFNLVEYTASMATQDQISDGAIDAFNPYAGYQSMDAVLLADEVAVEGETYTYTIYMQPTIREVVAGHEIKVTLKFGTSNGQTATFTVDNTASSLVIPVYEEVTTVPTADVAVQTAPSSSSESAFEVVLNEGTDVSVMAFYVTSEEDVTISAASDDFAVITGTKTGDTTPVIVTYKNGTADTYTADVATTIATIVVAGAGETISISDAKVANTVWENAATISADTATGVVYDVNGDGIVSLADIAFLKEFFGMEPTGELAKYDIDCNGDIGSSDFLTIFFCEAFQ